MGRDLQDAGVQRSFMTGSLPKGAVSSADGPGRQSRDAFGIPWGLPFCFTPAQAQPRAAGGASMRMILMTAAFAVALALSGCGQINDEAQFKIAAQELNHDM